MQRFERHRHALFAARERDSGCARAESRGRSPLKEVVPGFAGVVDGAVEDRASARLLGGLAGGDVGDDLARPEHVNPRQARIGYVHIARRVHREPQRFAQRPTRGARDPPHPFARLIELGDHVPFGLRHEHVAGRFVDRNRSDVVRFFFLSEEGAARRARARDLPFEFPTGVELVHGAPRAVGDEHPSRRGTHRHAVRPFHFPTRQRADEITFERFFVPSGLGLEDSDGAESRFRAFGFHDVHVLGRRTRRVVDRDAADFSEFPARRTRPRPFREQPIPAGPVRLEHEHRVRPDVRHINQTAGFVNRHANGIQRAFADLRQKRSRRAEHVDRASALVGHEHPPVGVVDGHGFGF